MQEPISPEVSRTQHVEQVSYDPYDERRAMLAKTTQGIYLVFGVIEAVIAIRFVLALLGANPASPFAAFMYSLSAPLVAPFVGLFGEPQLGASVLELHSLVAIPVYALVAWLLVKIFWLVFEPNRHSHVSSRRAVEQAGGRTTEERTEVRTDA